MMESSKELQKMYDEYAKMKEVLQKIVELHKENIFNGGVMAKLAEDTLGELKTQ